MSSLFDADDFILGEYGPNVVVLFAYFGYRYEAGKRFIEYVLICYGVIVKNLLRLI